jgi:hypothetical protein
MGVPSRLVAGRLGTGSAGSYGTLSASYTKGIGDPVLGNKAAVIQL